MPIDNSTRFPKPLAADLRELSEGMAIVIDGDTAPKAIASGQYLFIKNHSTLATGGYHATAAIASGADITSSNVTPDADGIVNGAVSALSEQIGKNNLNPLVNIESYNSTNNMYTCQSDGYFTVGFNVSSTSSDYVYGRVYGASSTENLIQLVIRGINGGQEFVQSTFVKKGMRLMCAAVSSNAYARFIPIV